MVDDIAGPNCAARLGDVPTLGAGAGPKLVGALASAGPNGPGRQCLLEALLRLPAEKGSDAKLEGDTAAAFVKVLPKLMAELGSQDEALLIKVLRALPAAPVNELGALLSDDKADENTRLRAARALFALDKEEARGRLVRAIGSGGPALRAELRRLCAASSGAVARLGEALGSSAPAEVSRRADLAFALGAAARAHGNSAEAGALLRDLAADPAGAFEVRARAVQALSALAARQDEAALAALEKLAREGDDPPLRLLATRGLGAGGKGGSAGGTRPAPGRERQGSGGARGGRRGAGCAGRQRRHGDVDRRRQARALAHGPAGGGRGAGAPVW